jgi:hypothetical protein
MDVHCPYKVNDNRILEQSQIRVLGIKEISTIEYWNMHIGTYYMADYTERSLLDLDACEEL